MSHFILPVSLTLWLAGVPLVPTQQPDRSRADAPAHARVVIVEDPRAVFAFDPTSDRVEQMVVKGLIALTSKNTATEAWRSLVSTQDVVGVKVLSSPGPTSGTRPAVAAAVVKGLLAAGLSPKQIIIWDKHLSDLRLAGFNEISEKLGVQLAGSAEEGYDDGATAYESSLIGKLVWGDSEFGKTGERVGRKSFVSKLLTQRITKVINITPLLNHNDAQVAGNLYSMAMGSVDNTFRFENPSNQLGQAVPEIYALADVGDRVVLNIVDALICQYQGEGRMLHHSTMLNQLRFGTDAVALDVLSIQELDRQRRLAKAPPVKVNWQIYTNAAYMDLGVGDVHLMDVQKISSGDD